MMLRTGLTIALLLAVLVPATASAQHFPPDADLTALIEERVERDGGMAMVVGVMEADGSTRIVSMCPGGDQRK